MRARTILGAALLAAAVAGTAGAEEGVVTGVVNALEPGRVTIDGMPYVLTANTTFTTPAGGRVAPHEIVEGTKVEAEVGDTGEVVVIKADIVR